ncbi:M23 family metallopeptidase [Candidatus Woesebacteria bacterium]|nr:M23 family metallopeptidase [Candidatus Woesebacteria bacterium]
MADDQSDVGLVEEPDQTEDLHLVPLHEVKQLKLESLADVRLAVATLQSVLTGKSDELFYDAQSPIFKLTSGGKKLNTTSNWRKKSSLEDKDNYLLASDAVQFIEQLGGWLVRHADQLKKNDSTPIDKITFDFVTDPDHLEDQRLIKNLGFSNTPNTVSLEELNRPEILSKIRSYFDQINTVVQSIGDATTEEITPKLASAEADDKQNLTAAQLAAATAKVVAELDDSASDAAEAGADEPTTEETREQLEEKKEAQRRTSVFSNEALLDEDRRRAEYHEFSWMYNHTLFDLMGKYGIEPDNLVMSQVAAVVKSHLGPMPDKDIRALFANPTLRYREIKKIYEKLAADGGFVRNLREQFEDFVKNAPPAQKKAFLESTGFDSLDAAQVEVLTEALLEKIKTTPQQEFLATPAQQSKASLSTLIDAPIDGVVEINFNRTIASTTTSISSEKLKGFIDALTPEQLALTFFADANNPDAVDAKTIIAIEANLKAIKAVLGTMLKTQAIDQIIANADSLKKRLGISDDDVERKEPPKDEAFSKENVAPAVVGVQVLTGAMGSRDSEEAVEGALTTNRELSHTQKLLNDYEKRVRRMWGQLDNDTRLRAYAVLFNIPPAHFDEQRGDLLKKIEHLREPDGSLPWTTSLFSLIDWETFLRQSKKAQLADELATRQKLSKVEKQQRQLLDETHRIQAEGFLSNLTPKQMEELEYSALLVQLKEANSYAANVAEKLKKNQVVSEVEYRGALASLARVQSRILALSQIEPVATDNKFVDGYREQVDQEGRSRAALWDELAAYKDEGVELTPEYYTLTIIETTYIITSVDAPLILLPTQKQTMEATSPNQKVTDSVTPATVLPQLEKQSLRGLAQASKQQNQLVDDREQIKTTNQTNQAMQDAVSMATQVAETLKKVKNPYAAAALLLADKDFREKLGRVLMKAAQVLAAAFIAGSVMVGVVLGKIMGVVGPMGSFAGGAVAGGTVGFMLGGPVGALLGGIGGGVAGYLAGQKLAALGASSGAELIPAGSSAHAGFSGASGASSAGAAAPTATSASATSPGGPTIGSHSAFAQANAPGSLSTVGPQTLAQSSPAAAWGSGATGTAVPGTATASGAASAGGAVVGGTAATSASGLGALLSGTSLIATLPVFSLLGVAMVSIYTIFVIYSAFLVPLPTGDLTSSTSTQSEYVTLTKQASPSTLDDDQIATVIYKVTIQTRRNYQIKVTDVSDTANTGFTFQSNRTDHVNPGVSPPASLLNPRISLSDFSPDFDDQSQTVEYSVVFSRGKKVLVSNTVTITYDVQNSQGELVASGETLSSTANVAIGDHGVFCWPTTGTLVQLPNGSYSHQNADAYDISAPLSTRVFSPFEGWAHKGDMGSRDYGKFVVVDSYVQGRWVRLIYGHLREASVGEPVANFWDNLAINHDTGGLENGATNNVGQFISAGDQIGLVDSTGHSTGNHLHYELGYVNGVRHRLNSPGISLEDLLPQPSSGTYQLGDYVTTCLAPP